MGSRVDLVDTITNGGNIRYRKGPLHAAPIVPVDVISYNITKEYVRGLNLNYSTICGWSRYIQICTGNTILNTRNTPADTGNAVRAQTPLCVDGGW